MSVSAITDGYCYHLQENVARAKRQMVAAARQRILVADCSKFSRAALYKIGSLTDFDIVITDTQTPPEIVADMRKSGLQVDVVQRFAAVGCVCPSWRLHEVPSPILSVNRRSCQFLVPGTPRAFSGVSPITHRDAVRLVWNYLIRAKEQLPMNASIPQTPHENGFAPLSATASVSPVTNPAGNSISDPAGLGASNASPSGFATPVPTPDVAETPRSTIATLADVTKVYGEGQNAVIALNYVNLGIRAQECTVTMRSSGLSKSTLLHVLAGLDVVTSGTITVGGTEITRLPDRPLTKWRREQIGFVFQSFNLMPTLDVRANTELPLHLAGRTVDPDWFQVIVESLNPGQRLRHKPWELPGGQVQRVAVARALLPHPAILMADESTGDLDSVSSAEVLGLLGKAVKGFGQTVVMVTHGRRAAATGDRVLVVKDGQIVHDFAHPSADQIAQVA